MHTDSEVSAFLKSNGLLLDDQLDLLTIDLLYEDLTIGRAKSNKVLIKIRTVSDNHAKITHDDSCWFIEDLQSENGTLIDDNRIDKITQMKEGDLVSIGGVEFEFGLNKPEILLRQDSIITNLSLRALSEQPRSNYANQTVRINASSESPPAKAKFYKHPAVIVSILILIATSSFLVMKFAI